MMNVNGTDDNDDSNDINPAVDIDYEDWYGTDGIDKREMRPIVIIGLIFSMMLSIVLFTSAVSIPIRSESTHECDSGYYYVPLFFNILNHANGTDGKQSNKTDSLLETNGTILLNHTSNQYPDRFGECVHTDMHQEYVSKYINEIIRIGYGPLHTYWMPDLGTFRYHIADSLEDVHASHHMRDDEGFCGNP